LLIIEQCNPDMASVPLEGYKYFQAINKLVDATLVTHERNKKPLEKLNQYNNIFYTVTYPKYDRACCYNLTKKSE